MSLIRKSVVNLHPYVPGEQPRGDVIKLNTNENPYPPSPRVAEALQHFAMDGLRRYPDPVCTHLRERIADRHHCPLDRVFVGNGSDEVLALAIRAFSEHGGRVGFFDPSYSLYPVLVAIEERVPAPVELPPDFGWAEPPEDSGSLFFVTNPNAPTGRAFSQDRIALFARRAPGVVMVDEAYVDFANDNSAELALREPNVLIARSFSKSFSLAGLRLGYALGHPVLIEALFKIKDSYNVSALAQALGAAALEDEPYFREQIEHVKATRMRISGELRKRGWKVVESETNFIFAEPSGHSAREVFDNLRRKSIYVRYFPAPRTGNHLRITIGTDAQMDAFLAAL